MRSINNEFYHRKAWKACQKSYMQSVGGICERCAAKGDINPARIVHHKTHLNAENVKDPAIAYGFDNLEALCQECHNKEHFGDNENAPRYAIIDGNLIF